MPEKQVKELQDLAYSVQEFLGLQRWRISVVLDHALPSQGQARMIFQSNIATIYICENDSLEVQKATIWHEMLHLFFRDAHEIPDEFLEGQALELWKRRSERTIDHMAEILYRRF
jgi:Zn-dependent peptidase ImmA (M78 family)